MKKILISTLIIVFIFLLTFSVNAQLPEGSACLNDYECASGVCQGGECRESNLVDVVGSELGDIEGALGGMGDGNGNGNGNGDGTTPSGGTLAPSGGGGTRVRGAGDDYEAEKIFSIVNPNRLYKFTINELPIPVTELNFITNTQLSNVLLNVKRRLERDSNIPKPDGLVYMYFHLKTENIPDNNLEKSNIIFRVARDWLDQNNLKNYKVVLQRYTTKWTIIKPQVMAENDDYYYYNALTPGFSWFAITSIPKRPTTPYMAPVTQAVCGDGIIDVTETCENCPEDAVCEDDEVCYEGRCVVKKRSKLWYLIIPAVLVILLLLLKYVFKKQVKKTKKEFKPVYKQLTRKMPIYKRRPPIRRPIRPVRRPVRRQSLKR